jgi:predicted PhzF superfamily epimerase YddE/YHI9
MRQAPASESHGEAILPIFIGRGALLGDLERVPNGEHVLHFSQGVDMGRPSEITARLVKRADSATAIYVGGRCVKIMEGTLCSSQIS